MKTCTKCEVPQERSCFTKHKKRKDGLSCWCKSCCKQYRQNNKEAAVEYKKQYKQDNKEAIAEKDKQYQQANGEKILEYKKQWYKNGTKNLTDSYIKKTLKEQGFFKNQEIPSELITQKRQLILTHRVIRSIKNELN